MSATCDKQVKNLKIDEQISIGGIRYKVTLIEQLDERTRITALFHREHRFETSEENFTGYSTTLTLPGNLLITVYM